MRPTGPIQLPSESPLISRSVPSEVSARRQSEGERVPAIWRMTS